MNLTQILAALIYASFANGQRALHSTSFDTCLNNSQITASGFNVSVFDNGTLAFSIYGENQFIGNDTLKLELLNSTQQIYEALIDPCDSFDFRSFCPSDAGRVNVSSNQTLPSDTLSDELFTTSMLDAEFRFYLNSRDTSQPVGCLKATLGNGVTASNASSSGGDDEGSGSDRASLNWIILLYARLRTIRQW